MDIIFWLEILLRGISRQPCFVPETKPASELFQPIRHRPLSLALTVDQFGGAEGIVTIEEIMDEVDTLQQELGLEIPRGKYAAVAGSLLERAKDVPEPGDVIAWQGISFTIHRALPRVVREVVIQW